MDVYVFATLPPILMTRVTFSELLLHKGHFGRAPPAGGMILKRYLIDRLKSTLVQESRNLIQRKTGHLVS
jgi:hypothetical protein